jgi:hypothetical protein
LQEARREARRHREDAGASRRGALTGCGEVTSEAFDFQPL